MNQDPSGVRTSGFDWGGEALLNPITVPTEQPHWGLQLMVARGSDRWSGHRAVSGHQLTTWQVSFPLWASISQMYNEGAPPSYPGVHPLMFYRTFSQSEPLYQTTSQVSANQKVLKVQHWCRGVPCKRRQNEEGPASLGQHLPALHLPVKYHPFAPQVASGILPDVPSS